MNPKKKLKALEEIKRAEEEASKYALRQFYFARKDRRDPDSFWMELNDKEVKVTPEELAKYSKYSHVIVFVDY